MHDIADMSAHQEIRNAEEKIRDRWDSRTQTLLGEDALRRLAKAHVVVIGTGGVGGYAVETLARSGIGHLTIVDADDVAASNINRQLIALHSSVGESKVELFAGRCRDINPHIIVDAMQMFVTSENIEDVISADADFVIDAIDTVAPKMAVITHCLHHDIPIISSMGAGGRVDPTQICYRDIRDTAEDGLARAVRQRLKKSGIRKRLRVVTSTEAPRQHAVIPLNEPNKRSSFGTLMSIPAIFGIFLANHVILKLAVND